MKKILLKPFLHLGKECIGKKIPGIKWSNTHKCWYIFCDTNSYASLKKFLGDDVVLDVEALRGYLSQRNIVKLSPAPIVPSQFAMITEHPLCTENLLALTAFKNMLLLKAYSPAKIKNYMNEFHQLLRLLGNRGVNSLGLCNSTVRHIGLGTIYLAFCCYLHH
jgi:hypothetical protein